MKKKLVFMVFVLALCFIFTGGKPAKAAERQFRDVIINSTNFPDDYVRLSIMYKFGLKYGQSIPAKKIKTCYNLELNSSEDKPIRDLKGVEYFQNLISLEIGNIENLNDKQLLGLKDLADMQIYVQGKYVDLSHLSLNRLQISDAVTEKGDTNSSNFEYMKLPKKLNELILWSKKLKELDLRGVENLETIELLEAKSLKRIQVDSTNTLYNVWVMAPQLVDFPITSLKCVDDLAMQASKAYHYDLSQNLNMTCLYIKSCNNQVLDLSNNKIIRRINIEGTFKQLLFPKKILNNGLEFTIKSPNLTTCNFSGIKDLSKLNIDQSNLKEINIGNIKNLEKANIKNCRNLKKLVLPKLKKENSLELSLINNPNLSQANFNNVGEISSLFINGGKFSIINLSKVRWLSTLKCYNLKKLRKVVLPKKNNSLGITFLNDIKLNKCNFTTARDIISIKIKKTNFKSINVSKLKRLKVLKCTGNKKLKKVYLPRGKKVKIYKDKRVVVHKK